MPDKDARGRCVRVEPAYAGGRLDRWLAAPERLGSRRKATEALERGRVWVDGVEQGPGDGARRLQGGEEVRLWLDRPGSATRQGPRRSGSLDIVFEDRDLLVVAKPAGLLTVPHPEQPEAASLVDVIADYWRSHGRRTPLAVHRLDRDTSGLVVFARTDEAQEALKDQFASRRPERVYLAVVHGTPSPDRAAWRTWLTWDPRARVQRPVEPHHPRGYEAISRYEVQRRFTGASLLQVGLETGKRHQIRVQAWLAGHPLIGERIYTGPPAPAPVRPIEFARQALHGTRLAFVHPRTGIRLAFDLAMPADMHALIGMLEAA